ncbi:MAG: ABC transporter substrate-binding protein [Synergistaceae bacterium]|nr:ABC transporter substrate-binding protein [Synergistaceae bacterium]
MKKIIMTVLFTMSVFCGAVTGEGGLPSEIIYGSGNYTAINPALYEHGEINSLLFAGLTAHDADNNVIPGLASSWTYDEATMTYTFKLRERLTFHDGKPLTCADVKFTIETIMNLDNGSEIMSNFEEIESIDALDDLTVIIKLKAPNVALPDYLSIGILPKHILDGQDVTTSDYNRNPIGAGPYKLVDWDMGQSIVLEKFDGFYLGAPKIERIIFKIIENYSIRALQMKSGELTLAQVAPLDAEAFRGNAGFVVYEMDTADYRGILYNFGNKFWQDNPGLPAALSYGIDRDAIIRSVLLGKGQPAWSPIQKGEYVNGNIEKYEYNPAKAQAAIEALGWAKDGDGYYAKGGQQLAFAISVRPSDPVRVNMAAIAAQNLQDLGVNCTVELAARTDWAGQFAFLIGWGSPFDPDDHTYKVFGTDKGANYSRYSNPEVDRVLTEARSEPVKSVRIKLYKEFQEVFACNPAYTFIAYIDAIYVAKPNLKGISRGTTLGHHGVGIFWNVYEWTLE